MSGHTPGPWRVRVGGRDNQDECDLNICGDIFVLADIGGPQYAHCHPNAYLMAAAPALLAACKAAEERIVKLYAGIGPSANRDDGSNGHAEQDDVVHMIRAAIAAAEPKP